ncbi:MAG: response regulator [Chloroflexota bacterium]
MKRILVVDDNAGVRLLLDEYLSEQGYSIIHARDGQEALDQFEHQTPDLLLLDIMMPKLDGSDLMRIMKRSTQREKIGR